MKPLLFCLATLFFWSSVAVAQECGGSGSNGMTNCRRGDPNVPLVPTPNRERPAGNDTVGPGKAAPPTGTPPQNRQDMRGQTPPGTIAR
jgi:hypothetical protein